MNRLLRAALFILILLFCTACAVASSNVTVIEEEAFLGDTALTEFTLSETVTTVGSLAFSGCSSLETVYCMTTQAEIAEDAFDCDCPAVIWCYRDSSMAEYAYARGLSVCYFDAFSIECQSDESTACILLPFSWCASDAVEADNRYSYSVYKVGTPDPVKTSSTSGSTFSFTPTQAGSYYISVTLKNRYTETTLESEPVSVSEKLIMGVWNGKPIEWNVLSIENNRALVISKGAVQTSASYFNPTWIKYKYCFWSGSNVGCESQNWNSSSPESAATKYKGTISHNHVPLARDESKWGTEADLYYVHARYWCNETFYNGAFTDAERRLILTVTNKNPDNPIDKPYKGVASASTSDKVFFLSYDEALTYMPTKADRDINCNWWLRTPGQYRVNAMYVDDTGAIRNHGSDVGHKLNYRPAMWIKIS